MESDLGSFRDPSGYIFFEDGYPRRKITSHGAPSWKQLKNSGLLASLQEAGLLIEHCDLSDDCIAPRKVPLISYPQEWSFSQYKDAALLTIEIAERALEKNFVLKDASAYNVQFLDGHPVFIDTLSFEPYKEGQPWVAYKQFCQHFLAPLALMSKVDVGLSKLMELHIDGVPLPLASKLLPRSTYLSLQLFLHIHLHAKSQVKYSDKIVTVEKQGSGGRTISRTALRGLLDGLKSAVKSLSWIPSGTEWGEYYSSTNYSNEALSEKGRLVLEFATAASPKTVWDLGANTGVFSQIVSVLPDAQVVSFDIDPAAVEKHYLYIRESKKKNVLPLVLDLTNPTPSYGWAEEERNSVESRGPADLIMALALIHHLAISNNVPLEKVAEYFSRLGNYLIIEFVPKSDSQVVKLLSTREDIFPSYTLSGFEEAFQRFYSVVFKKPIAGTERTLYLLKRK